MLEPVAARYRDEDIRRFFRGNAAFANPDLYSFLEEENYLYDIRLPTNQNLQRAIEHLLMRPVGQPSQAQRESTRVSPIRPRVGTKPVAFWRKWNGIRVSCFPAWVSLSPT
ncbi:TPA: hypothetical protein EYM26_03695 [Candidatus Poribacteria bacterium]|nr:hypothetical protein [Candidatus Poribacteria bacterium]